MTDCHACGLIVWAGPVPANDNQPSCFCVTVAADFELRRRGHRIALAAEINRLGLSRREVVNWVADEIYGYSGAVHWPNGVTFPIWDTLVDDAFTDGSQSWVGDFMKQSVNAPLIRPQKRVIPKLRLLDLAIRISDPRLAARIARGLNDN